MHLKKSSASNAVKQLGALTVTLLALSAARAQSIYSVNALGYVDANFVAGANLIANPLFNSDNTVSNLFHGVPDGTSFAPWNRAGQTFGPTNYYSASTGWSAPGHTLVAPDGGFLILPSAKTISFVGQPWELIRGPRCLNFPIGESVWNWMPLSDPANCSFLSPTPSSGTTLAKWNPQTQAYVTYSYFFGSWGPPPEPQLGLAEAGRFFVGDSFSSRSHFAATIAGNDPVPLGLPGVRLERPRGGPFIGFTFDWPSSSNASYAVFRSTNELTVVSWHVVQTGTAIPSNGVSTVTAPGPLGSVLYRLLPDLTTNAFPVLLGGYRGHSTFEFQFYSPVSTNYVVERAPALPGLPGPWQAVTNVSAGASNIVGVVDSSATAANGYYRVRY
jgi:hypothetical protein